MIQKNKYGIVRSRYLDFLPKIKEEKTQKVTLVGLTFLGITILGLFAINPTLSTIAGLRKSLNDNKILYENLKQKNRNLSILQQKYNSIQADLPSILAAVPNEPSTSLFLAQIQSLFLSHNLTLVNIGASEVELTKKEEAEKDYSSYVLNISASGSYEDILKFTSSLISFERIFTPDTISIVRSAKKNGSEITIVGKTYFKK